MVTVMLPVNASVGQAIMVINVSLVLSFWDAAVMVTVQRVLSVFVRRAIRAYFVLSQFVLKDVILRMDSVQSLANANANQDGQE